MRISDWSSDVCSSDLSTIRVQFQTPGQAARNGVRCGLFRGSLVATKRPMASLASWRENMPLRLTRRDVNTQRGITLIELLVALRSEEHTSKLQSLMRISYAVFCLKKKKKLISHNTQAYNYIQQQRLLSLSTIHG